MFHIVTGVHDRPQPDLLEVALAVHPPGLFPGLIERRQQYGGQNRGRPYDRRDQDNAADTGTGVAGEIEAVFAMLEHAVAVNTLAVVCQQ